MNKFLLKFKTTRLSAKLIRRTALVTALSLVISFALGILVFWPRLQREAQAKALMANDYITDSINDTLLTLADYADYLVSSSSLAQELEEGLSARTPETRQDVKDALFSLMPLSSHVRAVVLECVGGFFQAGLLGPEDRDLLNSSWYQACLSGTAGSSWSTCYITDVEEQPRSTIVRVSIQNIGGRQYAVSIFYDAQELMEKIEQLGTRAYTGFVLASENSGSGVLVPFFEWGTTGNITTQYIPASPMQQTALSRDQKGHYFFVTVPTSEWIFAGYIDSRTFNSGLIPYIILLFILCLVTGLLIFLFLVPSINSAIKPLHTLEETMQQVAANGPDFYSPVQTDDEIGTLSDVFNDMLDELRIRADEEVEQGKKEQQLRFNLMLSQIDSHFFYNTLNVINALARQGRTEEVVMANSALTTIFRDCMTSQNTGMTDTVAHEKEVVECYWKIVRLDPLNEAQLLFEIPDTLLETRIPKNIIQPLVENALMHGLDDPKTGSKHGVIKVSLSIVPNSDFNVGTDTATNAAIVIDTAIAKDKHLQLCVSNDGASIPQEQLSYLNGTSHEIGYTDKANSNHHVGLANIRKRLEFIYEGEASMEFRSGSFTEVIIQVPYS